MVKVRVFLFLTFLTIGLFWGDGKAFSQDVGSIAPISPGAGENPSLQDAGVLAEVPAEEADEPKESIEEMDIRTSTLAELAIWCRALGLSDGGSKDDLANRLRDYYALPRSDGTLPEGGRTIIIESARSTEYFTLEVADEDYARLKGGVRISLKEGDAVHRINAEEILYNRTRNWLSASGGVFYEKTEGDEIETFRGDSITVDLENWATILTNGQSQREIAEADSAYRFEGTVISVDSDDSIVMTKARVSNAKTEEPYWSLNASKMWLLSGSDWAVANAVLKVGEIPVLWLPFFYLPSDEIVFHPVVGMRTREGSFFQTTTYILGRPKAESSSESSFSSMFGDDTGMEKERHGLFLRSTGKKAVAADETSLSVLFDLYANLGTYFGAELSIPAKGVMGKIDISAGFALSREIYSGNTPYDANGEDHWTWERDEDGNYPTAFFSLDVPFRYRFKTTGSVAGKFGSFSWNMPFYSDPFIDEDFMDRSEVFDIMKLLNLSADEEDDSSSIADTSLGSYSWTLNSSLTPQLPSFFSPYLSSFVFSSISSNLAFGRKNSEKFSGSVSPSRLFFYPDKWTIFSLNASLAGTPLSLGGTGRITASTKEDTPDYLNGLGVPVPPWDAGESSSGTRRIEPSGDLIPPALNQSFNLPSRGGAAVTLDYRLAPASTSELQFSQTKWRESADVNWGDISSVLSSVRGEGSMGVNFRHSQGLFSTGFRFSATGAWQGYNFLDETSLEYDTESKREAARRRTFQQTQYSTFYEYTADLKPFYVDPMWKDTNFRYELKGLIARNEYDTNSPISNPKWRTIFGAWEAEQLEYQRLTANINASVMDMVQNLTLTASLPPEDASIAANATMRLWFSETNVRSRMFNRFTYEPFGLEDRRQPETLLDGRKRTYDPVYITQTFRYQALAGSFFGGAKGASYSFQQYAIYDPELSEWTNLTSTLHLGGFSTVFTMLRTKKYDLVPDVGWVQTAAREKLNPYSLRVGYAKDIARTDFWKDRLSLSVNVNSSLSLDLQRYTYSNFTFSLSFGLNIAKFLDIKLAVNSENNVIYRYLQNMPFFRTGIEMPGERNVFVDLVNSFRFDSDVRRRSSGFKLKSLSLDMTHHLGDWDATLRVDIAPYLDQSRRPFMYRFNNQITFSVKWIPIKEVKTEIYVETDQATGQNKVRFK